MSALRFEGREIAFQPGDTLASALFRAGVRTFSRSFKYHRRRGLYCLSGDCPNCLLEVDGEPNVRACVCRARAGQTARRQNAWPSAEFDLLRITDYNHWAVPVGFYYKTLIKPSWAWPRVEPLIRRVAGLGRVARDDVPRDLERAHRHPDVLVIGLGPAGLAAALGAAAAGRRVLAVDEGEPGGRLAPGPTLDAVRRLLAEAEANPLIELLPHHTAIGIYDGPEVPVIGPDLLHLVEPRAIVVATGALEQHLVFDGNDLPGVWLGRGVARMAGAHSLRPGEAAVVVAGTHEAAEHVRALQGAGTTIAALVTPEGFDPDGAAPSGVRLIRGEVLAATGRKAVTGVRIRTAAGEEAIPCDTLALSAGFHPQDGLLRQALDLPVWGAGDVVAPGPVDGVVAAARRVGGQAAAGERIELGALGVAAPRCGDAGYVCLCEDVSVKDVENAVTEGFRSTELLKRYTTITMGPCQGRLCHAPMRTLADRLSPGAAPVVAGPTTARPPSRPVRLEEVVAGARHHLERRTALHDVHVGLGARFLWAGQWKRVEYYGAGARDGHIEDEYLAVRRGVGLIDVGTLGKFLVTGADAVPFLERLYPNHVGDLEPGRLRYGLLLDEGGVIHDDGTICRLDDERFYLTVTTSGAEEAEAWMLDWRESWSHRVHLVNQTASLGALNLAGPLARGVLAKLTDDPVDSESFPYLRHRRITVAGVPCLAIRLGFVGELGYELHHPASRSHELWDALLAAGEEHGIRPFGIEAQRLLRLEKGHIIVSQDTDFETTPWRIGMDWAVKLEKDDFVGKAGLLRKRDQVPERLVGFRVDPGHHAPWEGAAVKVDGRLVGRVTSARSSSVLGHALGLCWVRADLARDGGRLALGTDDLPATIASGAFYDPEGVKLRG